MDFEWNKYKLTTKMTFDSPIEYILILPDKEKILITLNLPLTYITSKHYKKKVK